jgi:hypothetical protein
MPGQGDEYFNTVAKPMCFSTIQTNIASGLYDQGDCLCLRARLGHHDFPNMMRGVIGVMKRTTAALRLGNIVASLF